MQENEKKIRSNNKKKRNHKKRYIYDGYQEIYKECPKKLDNIVVNNNLAFLELARQPPIQNVKMLYGNLWATAGP
jgi:hypothetical protein